MKHKRTITIEVEREVSVKKRARTIHVQCAACGTEMEITIPPDERDDEAFLQQLARMAQAGALHSNHAVNGNQLEP